MKEVDPRAMLGGGVLGWLSEALHRRQWLHFQPQLVLLDTGMIAELSALDRKHLISFFSALTRQDGEAMGRAVLKMSEAKTCKVGALEGRGGAKAGGGGACYTQGDWV